MKYKAGDIVRYTQSSKAGRELGIHVGDVATVLKAMENNMYVYFHKWEHEEPAYVMATVRAVRFGKPAYKLPQYDFKRMCMFDKGET